MNEVPSLPLPLPELARLVVALVEDRLAERGGPVFVGLDGRSGCGKSTLARAVVDALGVDRSGRAGACVIEGDDFYAGGSARTWDARSPAERSANVIDWRRQRSVLERLRDHGEASWHPFDWDADEWDGDEVPLRREVVHLAAAPAVVLEGAYSCRLELHDLLDLRVLLDIPPEVRRARLLAREADDFDAEWDARWAAAEDHYFDLVMPPSHFDLVLGGQ